MPGNEPPPWANPIRSRGIRSSMPENSTLQIARQAKVPGSTEARQVVGGIRLAQEQYKAETGAYAPIHGKVRPADAAYCPNQTWSVGFNTMKKMSWAPNCGTIPFGTLPVHVDGEVMYGYATVAGVAADPVAQLPPVSEIGTIGNWPAATSTDWYVVYAKGDTDNNGELGVVVGHSFGKELFVREE